MRRTSSGIEHHNGVLLERHSWRRIRSAVAAVVRRPWSITENRIAGTRLCSGTAPAGRPYARAATTARRHSRMVASATRAGNSSARRVTPMAGRWTRLIRGMGEGEGGLDSRPRNPFSISFSILASCAARPAPWSRRHSAGVLSCLVTAVVLPWCDASAPPDLSHTILRGSTHG